MFVPGSEGATEKGFEVMATMEEPVARTLEFELLTIEAELLQVFLSQTGFQAQQ